MQINLTSATSFNQFSCIARNMIISYLNIHIIKKWVDIQYTFHIENNNYTL